MLHYLPLLFIALGGLLAVVLVRQFPWLGWLTVGLFVVTAYDWSGYTTLATFGGLAIYPADVAAVVLLAAIIVTPDALGHLRPAEIWIWGTLLAVVMISLVRGISEFGLGSAGNEFRAMLQLICFTTWAWGRMRQPGFDRALHGWGLVTGLALSAVMLWHIAQRGLGQVDQIITVHGQEVTSRPLIAGQALALGLLGLGLLVRDQKTRWRFLGLAFLGLAVLCQHRTVWLSLLAGVLLMVLVSPSARRRVLPLAFVGTVVILVAYSAGLLDPLINKFSLAYNSHGTFDDRISTFRTLIDQQNQQGSSTMVLGQPFGSGYLRREADGLIETFAPHNYYVLLYLRLGFLGAGLFMVALARGICINMQRRDSRAIGWSVAVLTFCFAYNLPFYMGPFLAVALTAARLVDDANDLGIAPHGASAKDLRSALPA